MWKRYWKRYADYADALDKIFATKKTQMGAQAMLGAQLKFLAARSRGSRVAFMDDSDQSSAPTSVAATSASDRSGRRSRNPKSRKRQRENWRRQKPTGRQSDTRAGSALDNLPITSDTKRAHAASSSPNWKCMAEKGCTACGAAYNTNHATDCSWMSKKVSSRSRTPRFTGAGTPGPDRQLDPWSTSTAASAGTLAPGHSNARAGILKPEGRSL